MTYPSARTIATGSLLVSLAVNGGAVVHQLARGQLAGAGVQSLALVVVALVWGFLPTLRARLDADLGRLTAQLRVALAQQRMSELACAELERQLRTGEVQIRADGQAVRAH